jgi:hypothetical protein
MITQVFAAKHMDAFRLVTVGLAIACIVVVSVEVLAADHGSIGQTVEALMFAPWNCAPVFAAFGVAVATRKRGASLRLAGYGFAVGAAGLAVFGHIVWAFDVGSIATSSSTSALLFVFLPLYAGACGLVLAALAGLIGLLVDVHRGRAH